MSSNAEKIIIYIKKCVFLLLFSKNHLRGVVESSVVNRKLQKASFFYWEKLNSLRLPWASP